MAIYTPNGLKVRLDPERVRRTLDTVGHALDTDDALLDTELWANLANGVSVLAALVTAGLTQAWLPTTGAAIAGFIAGYLFQQLFYSHWLKVLIPQFLGGWLIYLPASLALAVYLYFQASLGTGLVVIGVAVANWLGVGEAIILIPLIPVAALLKRLTKREIGDSERAFIGALDRQASRLGTRIDWSVYDRSRGTELVGS